MRTHTKEFQQNLTPHMAFEVLKEGNNRFVNNLKVNRNLLQLLNETSEGQFPFAVALSCMDSRTSVELIFDQGLGDIFSIRIAGNVVNEDIVGSIEYACKVVGSKLVVVLGHTRCGAIQGAHDHVELGNVTGLLAKIKPAKERISNTQEYNTLTAVEQLGYANVLHSLENILKMSPVIRSLYEEEKIGIVGGIYSVQTGRVSFIKSMFADMEKHMSKAEATH